MAKAIKFPHFLIPIRIIGLGERKKKSRSIEALILLDEDFEGDLLVDKKPTRARPT
jgi:hypothetical protein